jgi:tetratricopeptide (TPR) repeat protein
MKGHLAFAIVALLSVAGQAAASDLGAARLRCADALKRFAAAVQDAYGHDNPRARAALDELRAALAASGSDGSAAAACVAPPLFVDTIGAAPIFVPAMYADGIAHLRGRRYGEGLAALRVAMTRDRLPPDPRMDERARLRAVERLLAASLVVEAESALRELVAAVPSSGRAHYLLGRHYQSQLRPLEAARELAASAALMVAGAGAVFEAVAVLRLGEGDLDGAVEAYRRQLEVSPDHVAAHRRLGELYGQQGRADAALGEFAEALRLAPADVDALTARAQTHLRLERFGDAEADARRAVAASPSHEPGLYALGTALLRLDRRAEGEAVLRRFETLQSASRARADRNWQLARLKDEAGQRVERGDYRAAADLLQQAVGLAPDDPAILLAAGAVLVRSGQPAAAVPLLTRALGLRDTAEARRYLSEARAASGR